MTSETSTPSTKRKRSTSNLPAPSAPRLSTNDQLQPSSRDASGEEGDESTTPATASSSMRARKAVPTPDAAAVPPPKRPRTRSVPNSENTLGSSNENAVPAAASINKMDPGEPSETTEASVDIEDRSNRRRSSALHRPSSKDHHDDNNKKQMKPPAKAGLQDPAGYHTNPPPTGRPVRVYADGVFDLFHLGHMRQLEQAKHAFPNTHLIVGVTGDAETHKRKGLTVLNEVERAETVRHCKWVDEVIPRCPWIVDTAFLEEHQIDFVAHDDLPYGADEGDDIYSPIKARGQFLVTQRTEGVSTTGIITKIVKDYEKYISRQLKRGTSRQDLNVSWLKKNELDIKRHVFELRDTIRNNWSTTGQEVGKELRQLWQSSRPSSPGRASIDNGSRSGMNSPSLGRGDGIGGSKARFDTPSRPDSPSVGRNEDFATGYSLGLIGGVRSWMMRSRTSLHNTASHPTSPSGSEDDSERNGVQDQDTPKGTA